ncbi:MAG: NAD(P)-dependent oxidoreductase [Chitinispirillia bacterium]|jgi:dTDP-4-dehydrorhamnose reductase
MKNLLITGASGFLGWNVCHAAKKSWNVYGTYFLHEIKIPGCRLIRINLTKYKDLKNIFKTYEINCVIHTAAVSQPNLCQTNPEESEKINVRASQNLCNLCSEKRIPFLFTSTDLVFDGEKAPYSESDPVSPISIYGEQKVAVESHILNSYQDAAICRMPLMYGDGSPFSNSYLLPLLQSLQNSKEVTLFFDEYRTPASVYNAALGLLIILENRVNGIIHLGGREKISRYEFGMKLVTHLSFNPSLIKPISQNSIKMEAKRPKDVSLNSSRAFKLGYNPMTIMEEFYRIESIKKAVLHQ